MCVSYILEHASRAACLNTPMSDLAPVASALLANFITIRIPRCERLWTWLLSDLSPGLRLRLLKTALAGETLIGSCHHQRIRCHLLEAGHIGVFDRMEGGGREGWRLHFFCLGPSAVTLRVGKHFRRYIALSEPGFVGTFANDSPRRHLCSNQS
jgi:hypothetical protein